MNSTSAGWINLLIVWGIASAAGFFAMAALMLIGDWTLMQALFAAAVIFVALGSLLSLLFLKPLPGPQKPGSAGWKAPAPSSAKAAHGTSGHGAAHGAAQAASARPASDPAPAVQPVAAAKPAAAPAPAQPSPAAQGPGTRPATLNAPRAGGGDDLKLIKGIGPKLEKLCHSLGFFHFDQIAAWTPDEIAWVDQNLEGFKGRVTRDEWVAQARALAKNR